MSDTQQLIEAIEALVPQVAAAAQSAEQARKPDDDVMQALQETGVFTAFVPKRFGGLEIDYASFVRIGMTLGAACTSTGWVTTFCMEHNWLLAHFPQRAQEKVWGQQPYFLAPGSISPTGEAQLDGDEYVLNGRWQWGTGVMHADWVMLAGRVASDSAPDLRMFMIRKEEVAVEDTWHVDGMVATGSNDIIAENVRIPDYMSQSVGLMSVAATEGAIWHDSPTFRTPMIPFKCITAASPAVGCAHAAVRLFQDRISGRSLWGSGKTQMEQTSAQMRLGHLTVRLNNAEREMVSIARDLEALGHRAELTTPEERTALRIRCGYVVHSARDIVRDVVEASGASAHRLEHPMQRLHRDIHTLACHTVFDLDIVSEVYGQILLDLPPSIPA
jgi:3-hydroxy-9,10-secoandrosta-1,3,5(10)-triene-9,17-dione monooxygenase